MGENEIEEDDAEVAQLAVAALKAAQVRAAQSGRTIVLVVNGQLVSQTPNSTTVLKILPPRLKVPNVLDRIKRVEL